VHVAAHGAAVETIDVGGDDPVFEVRLGSQVATVAGAVRAAEAAGLRLISSRCVRWSVTDNAGGAWFPAGVLPKWDYHHRPFFHGHDLSLDVPAEALRVVCTPGPWSTSGPSGSSHRLRVIRSPSSATRLACSIRPRGGGMAATFTST